MNTEYNIYIHVYVCMYISASYIYVNCRVCEICTSVLYYNNTFALINYKPNPLIWRRFCLFVFVSMCV